MDSASHIAASTTDRSDFAPLLKTSRSAVANGSRLHCGGVDGRSASARRFRDLVRGFAQTLGGMEAIGDADAALVRETAGKTIEAESMQAAVARGERVDPEQSVRISNSLSRLLAQLERRRKALAPTPAAGPLAAHFARPPARTGRR